MAMQPIRLNIRYVETESKKVFYIPLRDFIYCTDRKKIIAKIDFDLHFPFKKS